MLRRLLQNTKAKEAGGADTIEEQNFLFILVPVFGVGLLFVVYQW